jgi:predicted glycogen debranching enzyme
MDNYIHLDKSKLVNLEYTLFREILRTNRAGAYSSSSIIGCNTRKYHGLLVTPLKEFDYKRFVFLSSLDISIVQHEKVFNLGIHKYDGSHYDPKGHKYIRDFIMDPTPKLVYRVGGVVLSVEKLLVEKEDQVLVKITLEDAHSPTTLRLKPFLAFRSVRELTKENLDANTKYKEVKNGISIKLYETLPALNMQLSKKSDFVPMPDWYRGIEYIKEQNRGNDYKEDLYVPGYFELPIKKGESIIFSGSLKEAGPTTFKTKFKKEEDKRIPRNTLYNTLVNSAMQFMVKSENKTSLLAGYHWYGQSMRGGLMSLPWGTEAFGDKKVVAEILADLTKRITDRVLDNEEVYNPATIKSIDIPLWLFWTIQQLEGKTSAKTLWKKYKKIFTGILNVYVNANRDHIKVLDNGLIYGKVDGRALTWMKLYSNGKPVTQRPGTAVEINALWYNALRYSLELAEKSADKKFVEEWAPLAEKVGAAMRDNFLGNPKGGLIDCRDYDNIDYSVRPNQLVAIAMPYTPFTKDEQKSVLDIVKKVLLTPSGIRTLSPDDPEYLGVIQGDINKRNLAMHKGGVYPGFVGFFAEKYLEIHRRGGLPFIKNMVEGFEQEMTEHCLGTISECYDGDPPHKGKGAVSLLWNVTGVLKMLSLIEQYSE